jgi:hypothetical protein
VATAAMVRTRPKRTQLILAEVQASTRRSPSAAASLPSVNAAVAYEAELREGSGVRADFPEPHIQ